MLIRDQAVSLKWRKVDVERWKREAKRRRTNLTRLIERAVEALLGDKSLPPDAVVELEVQVGASVYLGRAILVREDARTPDIIKAPRRRPRKKRRKKRSKRKASPTPAISPPQQCWICGAPYTGDVCGRCGTRRDGQ